VTELSCWPPSQPFGTPKATVDLAVRACSMMMMQPQWIPDLPVQLCRG
jgi:hypothetical protein